MKKKILFLITILVLFPLCISAKTYNALDSKIELDDTNWMVFTRENIKENKELEEIGLTEEYMNNLFNSNSMYLDAVLFDEKNSDDTIELFIIAKATDLKNNLHMFSNKDIKEAEKEIIKGTVSANHDIYENEKYKYIYMYYSDQGLNICDYYTVINGYVYTVKIQKVNDFTDEDKALIKSVVDNISFNINEKYEVAPKKYSFNFTRIIVYAVIGGVAGGLSALISKKKKSK